MRGIFLAVVHHGRRGGCSARASLCAPLFQLSGAFALCSLGCLAHVAVSPAEQQVTGDAIVVLAVNQNDLALVASHPTEPRNFIQFVLHVSGEAPLLLG